MKIAILPSLLAADVGHLADGARRAATSGADALHLDIMDGVFVPNVSMGPAVVAMADSCVDIPLNVHLMMLHPDQYVDRFIDAGADSVLIHVEADCDVRATLEQIRARGKRAGVTLNPETPSAEALPYLDIIDELLCMTVHPGYGGQAFMAEVLPKLREVRDAATAAGNTDMDILVDGGVDMTTAPQCVAHGANCLIAGTSLYAATDMSRAITEMRAAATAALVE